MASQWVGQPRIKGFSETMRMVLLTSSIIGIEFAWGTEMTYCNPYLLSLGMPKSKLSLVWIAGPLSGLVMQPIIGTLSDKSTSKYGRRRPYMMAGSIAVATCYLILGWSKELGGWFSQDAELKRQYAIIVAVVDIYILDFLINIAMSACRALVVDTLPISKQQLGAAWISRMIGIGRLMVYAFGATDLNAVLGNTLGDTQFKKECVIAALAMTLAQGLTCWAVQERVLVESRSHSGTSQSISGVVLQIYDAFLHVPERIQAICWVNFWAYIGWFPFLFYSSTWVGEIYLHHEAGGGDMTKTALDKVGQQGSRALIVYSIVGTASSIVLPWLIQSPEDEEKAGYTSRPPRFLEGILKRVKLRKPTLLTSWALSNLVFASAMIFAPLVKSVAFATVLMAVCGVSSAFVAFAPVTFLGVEVNRMSSAMPTAHSRSPSHRKSMDSMELSDSPTILHLRSDSETSVVTSTGELSGIYLGILNIYTTLPQFVGTAISWVVFSILDPGKSAALTETTDPGQGQGGESGVSAIGVCLFVGALSAIGAAWATRRLRRSQKGGGHD